jgi:hypothetical protein
MQNVRSVEKGKVGEAIKVGFCYQDGDEEGIKWPDKDIVLINNNDDDVKEKKKARRAEIKDESEELIKKRLTARCCFIAVKESASITPTTKAI